MFSEGYTHWLARPTSVRAIEGHTQRGSCHLYLVEQLGVLRGEGNRGEGEGREEGEGGERGGGERL